MTPEIILGGIVILPVIAIILLRINAALVFMSLCLGDVLVQFAAPNANSYLAVLTEHSHKAISLPNNNTVHIALLLTPAVLTAIFMIRTVQGKTRLLLNILPAIGAGLLTALLLVPLMSAGLRHNIVNSSLWLQVERWQDLIVAVSAIVCMFVLWMQRPKTGGGESKHSKHHKA